MKFGKHILTHRQESWEDQYLDYKALKKLITKLLGKDPQGDLLAESERTEKRKEFFARLEQEIEKVGSFYQSEEEKQHARYKELKETQILLLEREKTEEYEGCRTYVVLCGIGEGWEQLNHEVDNLASFAELNSTAVRKIVKKWDKRAQSSFKEVYLEQQRKYQAWFDRKKITELSDNVLKEIISTENLARALVNKSSWELWMEQAIQKNNEAEITRQLFTGALMVEKGKEGKEPFIQYIKGIKRIDSEWKAKISGRTLIHAAAKVGIVELVILCIENKVDVEVVDRYGKKALYYAISNGNSQIVKLILENFDKNELMVDSHDTQAVQFAASEGQLECMSEILEYLKQRGLLNESIPIMERALFKSCGRGTWEIARLLSQYGLEVESAVELKSGLTALHTAAAQGCLEIMVWLIEQGADIDIKDKDMGWTALFYAAKNGYGDCVDLLLTHGANINQTDEQGKTAGFYAAYEGHHAISCKLIPTISDSTMSSMQLEDFIPDLELPPPVIPYYRREYSQNLRTKQLVVRLKILDKGKTQPIKFINHLNLSSIRIQVGSLGQESHTFKLPILKDQCCVIDLLTESIDISIFATFGNYLIANGTITSGVFSSTEKVENFVVLLTNSLNAVVAELKLSFLVIKPFDLSAVPNLNYSIATPPPAPSHDEFASKYLNIKVQLTKDLVPVIYKDDLVLVNESIGLYLPICALTYSELSKLLRNDPSVFPKFGFLKAASQEFTTTRYLSERLALGSSGYPLEKALTEIDERIGLNIEVYSGTSHSADETMTCCYGNKNLAVDMILKTLLPFSCSSQALIDAGDQLLGERGHLRRSIFVNSKDVDTVLMLCSKQAIFPVFLRVDTETMSLKSATEFASLNRIFGLIISYQQIHDYFQPIINAVRKTSSDLKICIKMDDENEDKNDGTSPCDVEDVCSESDKDNRTQLDSGLRKHRMNGVLSRDKCSCLCNKVGFDLGVDVITCHLITRTF